MNKDTILKSDIKEIIRALRNDIKHETEAIATLPDSDDRNDKVQKMQGYIDGIEWAIRNFELNI